MASQSTAVNMLAESCKNGDPYSGLQALKAVLHRKIRARDETAAQSFLVDAFRSVAIPYRSAEVALDLGAEFFGFLKSFGHDGDSFGLEQVRVINGLFIDIPESEVSVEWCKAHVTFVTRALDWWECGEKFKAAAGTAEVVDPAVFLHEAICNANIRLAHRTAAAAKAAGGEGEVGAEEEVCRALANAYRASFYCAPNIDLIRIAAGEVHAKLTLVERPFLIARTIYGLLSNVGKSGTTAKSSPSFCAVDAATSLLASETTSSIEDSALHSFLYDVLLILKIAVTTKKQTGSSDGCECSSIVGALSDIYRSCLVPVKDLDWVALSALFLKGC